MQGAHFVLLVDFNSSFHDAYFDIVANTSARTFHIVSFQLNLAFCVGCTCIAYQNVLNQSAPCSIVVTT